MQNNANFINKKSPETPPRRSTSPPTEEKETETPSQPGGEKK